MKFYQEFTTFHFLINRILNAEIMIKFEFDKIGVDILLDKEGVEELINYLQFIKLNEESIHLTAGNELNDDPSQNMNNNVKHVKIVYIKS